MKKLLNIISNPCVPVILVALLIALFSTVLPAQGGYPTTAPSALPAGSFFVVQQIGANSTGVRVDSFATKVNIAQPAGQVAYGNASGTGLTSSTTFKYSPYITTFLNTSNIRGSTVNLMEFRAGSNSSTIARFSVTKNSWGATNRGGIMELGVATSGTSFGSSSLKIISDSLYTNIKPVVMGNSTGNYNSIDAHVTLLGTSTASNINNVLKVSAWSPSVDDSLFTINKQGVLKLLKYGSGNKEASDLSKTQSNFLTSYATDGTLLDTKIPSLTNIAPATNDSLLIWDSSADIMGRAAVSDVANLGGNGIYSGDGTAPADVDVTVTDSINFDAGTLFINGVNNRIGIGTVSPQRTLQVTGEARITDLTTDTPTRIVGADGDGDLGAIKLGTGLQLSNDTLNASVSATVDTVRISVNVLKYNTQLPAASTVLADDFFTVDASLDGWHIRHIQASVFELAAAAGTYEVRGRKLDVARTGSTAFGTCAINAGAGAGATVDVVVAENEILHGIVLTNTDTGNAPVGVSITYMLTRN